MGREEGKEEQERFYLLALFQSGFAISGQMFEVDCLRAFLRVLQRTHAGPPSFRAVLLLRPAATIPSVSVLMPPIAC